MRQLLTFAVVVLWMGSSVASARPKPPARQKPKLAVLSVEAIAKSPPLTPGAPATPATPASATIDLAAEITTLLKLRSESRNGPHRAVATDKDLPTVRAEAHCPKHASYCMAKVAVGIGTELLLWGQLEQVATGHRVTLTLFDVSTRKLQVIDETLEPDFSAGIPLARWTEEAYDKLATGQGTTTGSTMPPPRPHVRPPMPPRPIVGVLGLDGTAPATDLTTYLRAKARYSRYQLATDAYDLSPLKRTHRCATEAIACMTAIAKAINAEHLVWGKLARRRAALVVKLSILDVAAGTAHVVVDTLPATATAAELERWADRLYRALAYRTAVSKPPGMPTKPHRYGGDLLDF